VYDSFGDVGSSGGTPYPNDILFQGRELYSGDKKFFFRNRSYSPLTGRFNGEDPISPYQYLIADGNPLYYTDPMGLSSQGPIYSISTSVISSLTFLGNSIASRIALSAFAKFALNRYRGMVIGAASGGAPGLIGISWKLYLRDKAIEYFGYNLGTQIMDQLWLIL
jgi:RHS repeat-associated protein